MSARKIFYHIIIVSIISLTFGGCFGRWKKAETIPPLDEHEITAALNVPIQIYEIKGFGDITITTSGQSMSGTIDAVRRNTGFFNSQIYTPFGSAIATINATDSIGRAVVNRTVVDFIYNSTMTGIPFPSANLITFGNFLTVITASMPDVYWNLSQTPPDTLARNRRRNTVTASWITDTLTVRAQMSQKTRALDNIVFNYDFSNRENGGKYSLRFERFRNGVPHQITVRENARNFISVTYEDVMITDAQHGAELQPVRQPTRRERAQLENQIENQNENQNDDIEEQVGERTEEKSDEQSDNQAAEQSTEQPSEQEQQ